MRIKITGIWALFLLANPGFAQDPHFSNFLSTLSYLNPSSVISIQNPQLSATYRNQWPAMNSAFVTYCAAFTQPVETMNSVFGVSLIHDNQAHGAIVQTSLAGVYAYSVQVSDLIRLAGGLELSYIFQDVNENRLIFESDITGNSSGSDPIDYDGYKSGYGDFSLGITMNYDDRYYSGIAVHHITQPVRHDGEPELLSLSRRYALHLHGKFDLFQGYRNKNIVLVPGIQFQQQKNYQELIYGTNCEMNPFVFGLWARQDLRFNFDAVILLAGFSWQGYNFYYTYDVNMKNIRFFSTGLGAHEVTFLYHFQYNGKRKNRGAVKCPRI
ncbi:MAG TPA: PorP/SprF family type IX secretion system membrane protein [Bacteroidales bacterium]|nr:PorP/SprF family type IX secretion system membrane protein [Bacteroidales bacterium]